MADRVTGFFLSVVTLVGVGLLVLAGASVLEEESSWVLPGVLAVVGLGLIVMSVAARRAFGVSRGRSEAERMDAERALDDVARADPEIRALVRGGQTILAIKLLRERTGAGLREAKEAVDRLR